MSELEILILRMRMLSLGYQFAWVNTRSNLPIYLRWDFLDQTYGITIPQEWMDTCEADFTLATESIWLMREQGYTEAALETIVDETSAYLVSLMMQLARS